MVFKLGFETQKHWRRLNGTELIQRWLRCPIRRRGRINPTSCVICY
jgi:hypothetical protein